MYKLEYINISTGRKIRRTFKTRSGLYRYIERNNLNPHNCKINGYSIETVENYELFAACNGKRC